MKGSKRVAMWIMVALGILFLGIQFVPVDRSNPATQTQVPASAEARAVLQRACYDCHSNETVWPWYSYVAPVSWLAARDVRAGREKLNYSTWNLLSPEKQAEGLKVSWEKVQEGEMPLWFYVPLHPSAKLSPADRAALQAWASPGGAGADTGSGAGTGTGAGTGAGSGAGSGAGTGTGIGTGSGPSAVTGTDSGTTSTGAGTGTGVEAGAGTGSGGAGESRTNGGADGDGDND